MAGIDQPARGSSYRSGIRSRSVLGRDRRSRVRRGLADGGLATQPRRHRDRPGQRRPAGQLRRRPARLASRAMSSDRRTASGTTSSMITSVARPAWPRARQALAARGMRLILDFVPNHVAPDHPWTTTSRSCSWPAPPRTWQRDPAVVRRGGRPGPRQRARPLLPGVAGCRSAQRLRPGTAGRGDRDVDTRSPTSATACAATWRCW